MRSKILSKLIFPSCVWYSDRAYYGFRVFIKDIGRRLPLQLQCSYQGQQGDARQSLCARKLQNPFRRGTKSDSCGGKCIRLSSKSCKSKPRWGGGGVLKNVGSFFWSKASGVGGRGSGGEWGGGGGRAGNLCVEAKNPLKGINLTV